MRTGALLLGILMIAAAPTMASAKKMAAPAPTKWDTTPANSMDNTMRFFRDGMGGVFKPKPAPVVAAAPMKMHKHHAKKMAMKKK